MLLVEVTSARATDRLPIGIVVVDQHGGVSLLAGAIMFAGRFFKRGAGEVLTGE